MAESEYERRQRLAAERMIKAAMPNLQRVLRDIAAQSSLRKTIGELFSAKHEAMLRDVAKSYPRSWPTPPALKLDYQALFPNLASVHAENLKKLQPSIKAIQDIQRGQFAVIIARTRAAVMTLLPPNWAGADLEVPGDLESLLLDEGLPLAWVPPHDVVVKLFNASTPAERRKILGNRWKSITRACISELQNVAKPKLAEHVEFALEAAETLLDGKSKSSQALSANLLDSILRRSFSTKERTTITGQKKRLDIDDYPLRVAIVLGGIWGSHGEYWPDRGDRIPRSFSRHGSAHGVGRRQYSRINALLALMHVTALLKVIEVDLS